MNNVSSTHNHVNAGCKQVNGLNMDQNHRLCSYIYIYIIFSNPANALSSIVTLSLRLLVKNQLWLYMDNFFIFNKYIGVSFYECPKLWIFPYSCYYLDVKTKVYNFNFSFLCVSQNKWCKPTKLKKILHINVSKINELHLSK